MVCVLATAQRLPALNIKLALALTHLPALTTKQPINVMLDGIGHQLNGASWRAREEVTEPRKQIITLRAPG